MELWIRSQDRENTVKINRQYGLHWEDKTMIIADYQPDFVGTEGEYYELLGKYSTKERALEVLDEIQNFMCIEIHENNIDYEKADLILKGRIVDSLCKIYQMPKE